MPASGHSIMDGLRVFFLGNRCFVAAFRGKDTRARNNQDHDRDRRREAINERAAVCGPTCSARPREKGARQGPARTPRPRCKAVTPL
eukprot:6399657-Pyramimonas_sp.AAC.1